MNDEIATYAPHCKLSFDALEENFPHLVQRKKDPADAIYGRVLTYPTEGPPVIECYQYILFWKLQKIPEHEFDYGPIFVYKMKDQNIIVYDKGHYVAERRHIEPDEFVSFKVENPWHSFGSKIEAIIPDSVLSELESIPPEFKVPEKESYEIIPLNDETIRGWWNEEGEKRFRIVRNLKDPLRLLGYHDFDDPPFSFLDHVAKEIVSIPPTIRGDVSKSKELVFAHAIEPLPQSLTTIPKWLELIQLHPEIASTKFLLHMESLDREEFISAWDNAGLSGVSNSVFDGE